jgi:dimethylhistidine N-methyltransferase
MARRLGPGVRLVELGSGSSLKTRYLLDVLEEPAAYVPVDISRAALQDSCRRLHREYPGLDLRPVCADFTRPFPLPEGRRPAQRSVVYFPGSTVGNFTPDAAVPLLSLMAEEVGPRGGLLIGVDLKKDPHVLHRAYNDARGITAAFDLNLLHRLNRECGADFQLDCWRHYAFYNPQEGRVEMHLISCRDQEVAVAGESFAFASGESICTEYSYKFEPKAFATLAARAGFTTVETWTDPRRHFGVVYLEVAS